MQLEPTGKDRGATVHRQGPRFTQYQLATVWVDEADGSLVIQGWKLDEEATAAVNATAPVPEHETVLRIPARMAPFLKEAMGDV